jgi:oligosaccharyltransferase complex subunit beta
LDFVDGGGNLLLAVNGKVGEAIQKLATECGVELDEEGTALIDHWNYDEKDDGKHTLVVVDTKNLLPVNIMVGEGHTTPFLYRGIGISNDAENPLLLSVLHASSSSFSYNPDAVIDSYPTAVGSGSQLISALQARNNARIVISGSLDFFSDELITAPIKHALSGASYLQSGNKALADALSRWVFQESGVLRYSNVSHRKLASSDSAGHSLGQAEVHDRLDSSDYTIMDEVEYSIVLEELVDADPKGRVQKWQPYKAQDVQLQFVRIDPFVRLNMKQDSATGKYYLRFKLPDVYGVFKFLVDYNRAGYSRLFSSTQVSVRPLWHTQYERFIPAAYPYYVSAFSMMTGLLLFSVFFLHSRWQSATKTKSE